MSTARVTHPTLITALVAVVAVLGAISVTRVASPSTTDAAAAAPPPPAALPREPGFTERGFTERGDRDVQIRVWHQALDADPISAIAMGQLAALHLQRAREGGSWDDLRAAEGFARRSLRQRARRNGATASTLVSILLAQHRFLDARSIADSLVRREPDVPEYRATLAEVLMELGDDAGADSLFRSVWANRSTLTIAARLARWLELTNHVAEARRLITSAKVDAWARRDVASETKAWFALRVGDLELRSGRLNAAERAFREGLSVERDDPRLLAAMARLAAARSNHADVIEWGERAIGLQLDPATLGLIGDAYLAKHDTIKAAEYLETLNVAVCQQPGAYHRAWSLHLLDHGLHVSEVLEKAQAELRHRKDVYGYDVVAWALEKSGRRAEAQRAMRLALRLNTSDPLLWAHARAMGLAVTAPPATATGE